MAVEGCQGDFPGISSRLDKRHDRLFSCKNRDHLSRFAEFFCQSSPLYDEPQSLFKREYPGGAGCRVFPQAVAQHKTRPDSPRFPQGKECHLEGKEGRLGVAGLIELRGDAPGGVEKLEHGLFPLSAGGGYAGP